MNLTDFIHTGGAFISLEILPIILFAGFVTPLPYNYWRLKFLKNLVTSNNLSLGLLKYLLCIKFNKKRKK